MDIYLVLLLLVAISLTLYYYRDKIFGLTMVNSKKKSKTHKKYKKVKKQESSSESDSEISELPEVTEKSKMSSLSMGSDAKNKLFNDTEIDLDDNSNQSDNNTFGSLQSGLSKEKSRLEENDADSPISIMG